MPQRMKKTCRGCRAEHSVMLPNGKRDEQCLIGRKFTLDLMGERRPVEICPKPKTREQFAVCRMFSVFGEETKQND